MKKFDITYFFGPSQEYVVKEETIADMAASGITLCQLLGYDVETNKQALRLMKKYGLRATVFETRVREVGKPERMDEIDETVKAIVEDYQEFDNIVGWDLWDEPNTEEFPILAKLVQAFQRYAPEQETVINLYPNYVPVNALKDKDYESHLRHFVETVHPDFISYDHYPFMGRNLPGALSDIADIEDEKERLIRIAAKREFNRGEFFENLEVVRSVGLSNRVEQMMIAQLTEHGSYRNLTMPEIRWQVNMCLAYGFHRISYFTYWLPESDADVWMWDNAMVSPKGEKYQHYYDVQAVNREIYDIGTLLFEVKSEAVFHIGTEEVAGVPFDGYGAIKKIEGSPGVVGFFENGYVYLVNYDFIEETTFSLTSEKPLFVYEDGQFRSLGHDCTVTLSAGGAKLLKI